MKELEKPPEQTQELRAATLGASSVAGALGLSQYASDTPLADWMKRQPGYEPEDPTIAMLMGHATEAINRDAYTQSLPFGWRVMIPDQQTHPAHPWLTCHPDGFVLDDGGATRWGFEAKWTSRNEYRHNYPINWVVQCQVSMAICELDRWDLSIIVGGSDPVTHTLEHDPGYTDQLIALASEYWNASVVGGARPDPQPVDLALLARGSHSRDELVQADPDITHTAMEHAALLSQIAALQVIADSKKLEIAQAIGDAAGIEGDFGKVYFKAPKPRRVTDWRRLAMACEPSKELAQVYTTEKQSARAFRAYYTRGADDGENGAAG